MSTASPVVSFDKEYIPDPREPLFTSIFQQYERVLIESLITSFGLDFIVKDQHGGDVDTIHNVRQIGTDPEMTYKNVLNEQAYRNRETYDYEQYHGRNLEFGSLQRETKKAFQGTGEPITDVYTGKKLYFYSKGAMKGNGDKQASIDHVLTAHTISNDRGRILAGLSGEDLANAPDNLVFTNAALNSSMGATKESPVLVNVEKYISANPNISENDRVVLRDIAAQSGANGIVDVLAILNNGSKLSKELKQKVSVDNKITINASEVATKFNLQKSDLDALKKLDCDQNGNINILDVIQSENLSGKAKSRIQKSLKEPVDIPRYIELHPELDSKTKAALMKRYGIAVSSYEAKLRNRYYTSPQFRRDMTYAAMNVGARMGVRQAVGFVFAEIWFAVKDELQKADEKNADLKIYMEAVANGFQNGLRQAREKYPELCSRFLNGAVAGALSSITTTLCNIFFTTAKSTVRIIRQSYASVVQAMEVLFINPDNYEFGDRMRAVVNILSIGASVTVGVLVSDAIAHTPLGALGKTGEIIQSFCGAFVTGIMSCTLLMYLDRSETMNALVKSLNSIHTVETELNYYREYAKYFEQYAANLMQIDLGLFEREISAYKEISEKLNQALSQEELNRILRQAFTSRNLPLPWEGFESFDSFMRNDRARLVFQ